MPKTKLDRRVAIKRGIRKKIAGTSSRPRLTVFRSNTAIYAQIINDLSGVTLVSASSIEVSKDKSANIAIAKEVGKILATKAVTAGVNAVVFDRNGYLYHGKVKALADAAREAGLNF